MSFIQIKTGIISLCLIVTIQGQLSAQKSIEEQFQGAWQTIYTAEHGKQHKVVAIVMDNYIAETEYNLEDGSFIWTIAGSWTVDENIFKLNYECSSGNSADVGTTRNLDFSFHGEDTLKFAQDSRWWTRIDNGKGDLAGAWLITGRERDGEMQRSTPGSRKTMKILSGTRFQWIAYDIDSKSFRGCGGGTYTATGGDYVENIEFFSRDNSRVGASLPFNYEVVTVDDGAATRKEWHHSGKSSKGDPIYEIWSRRRDLE